MAAPLETVVKQLTDSGIIAPGKLENFVPPKATPKDGEELLRQLVQSKHLTKFQAQEIYQGRGKSLLLGNYTILDRIGAGGMGQVFKAEHRRMHRLVAIKMLPAALTNDAAALARFEREVTAAAKLRHPNVVAADDADEAGGVHFLVMEYVEGQDLSALVKKNGPFPVAKAVHYILQAARGLEFAHGEGVVHRDIKPANLLLDKKGTVKILDMGLARLDHPGGDVATQAELTGTGAVMGTVDYMAPEQALNTKHADHRADIYSLGITLYYLVAGKCAYDGETLMEKLMAHQTKPIPSLKEVQGGVPDNVQSIFAKMVAKKKEDRYQSMGEVIADLERCQAGLSSSSASTTGKTVSSSGTEVSEVTAAFGSHPSPQSSSKSEPEPDRKEPPKKNLKLLAGAGAAGFLLLLLGVIVIIRNQKGEEVGRMEFPDATSVEVQTSAKPDAAKAVAGQPNKSWNTPAFQQWVKDTQTLAAEKQIEAVSKKLIELNPRFDGKVTSADRTGTPKIQNGVVTEFGFLSDNVPDISPIRAFAELKNLNCSGGNTRKSNLSNLSPLQGMQLIVLFCNHTRVSDLSPLEGMKLKRLEIAATQVSDFSPLLSTSTLVTLKVPQTNVTPAFVTALQRALPNCKIDWDDPAKPVADQPNKPWNTPGFQQWVKATQALSAEQQIEAVSKKLIELNPGFDGKVAPQIAGGVVRAVTVLTNNVTDISPIRALPGLESLGCSGSVSTAGRLFDLSSLEGMKLSTLHCSSNKVADLTPLKGMPLTVLACIYTQVSDLSPLRGVPLKEIACHHTPVADLSPIGDCTGLRKLDVRSTKVTPATVAALQKALPNCKIEWDDPAKAMTKQLAYLDPAFQQWVEETQKLPAEQQIAAVSKKLVELNPGFDGKLTAASGPTTPNIENGVVTGLGLLTDNVIDISPVRAFVGLKALTSQGVGPYKGKLSSLAPLQGMHLTSLNCGNTDVSDLSVLHGMPLSVLACHYSQVSDLSPLQGMPLTYLRCHGTHVSDLSPLKGMEITTLDCFSTQVSGLSPLHGMPLTFLACHNTPVSDLSALENCKGLKTLNVSKTNVTPASVAALQKALPNCKIEWGDPAKAVATQRNQPWNTPAFQQWVKATQALPAEQQIEAVSKKLIELNPGFDGKLRGVKFRQRLIWNVPPKIAGGMVIHLGFITDDVTDISPLRALAGLKILVCSGSNPGKGKLSDMSPLQGMTLTSLDCHATQVTDLSPLQEMPLTHLYCDYTQVSNVAPLRGVSLIHLSCHHTNVADLSPLQGMPLSLLACDETQVSDLTPLKECKELKNLHVSATKVTPAQVASLQKALPNCKIEWDDPAEAAAAQPNQPWNTASFRQWVAATQKLPAEQQIEAVSKKLMELNPGFDGKVMGLDPQRPPKIEKGVVTEIGFITDNVTDISPVRALAGLNRLNCNGKERGSGKVSDLSPLHGMPLTKLICGNTNVSNLSPLDGMPLEHLESRYTLVSDLSPLTRVSTLVSLKIQHTKVTLARVAALQKDLPNCKIEWDGPVKP